MLARDAPDDGAVQQCEHVYMLTLDAQHEQRHRSLACEIKAHVFVQAYNCCWRQEMLQRCIH
jgi:hypothetical protein